MISENIYQLLREKKMTQAELAAMIPMSSKSLNNRLRNESEFKLNELRKIAEIFKVKLNISIQ